MKKPPLHSFRVANFKAIRDSGWVELGWLNAFIGDNGTGKSSLVEAVETFRDVAVKGVDSAFERWLGFENVWNKSRKRKLIEEAARRPRMSHAMKFGLRWRLPGTRMQGTQFITQGPGGNTLFLQEERLIERWADKSEIWSHSDEGWARHFQREVNSVANESAVETGLGPGESIMKRIRGECFDRWQFLALSADRMGYPRAPQLAAKRVTLSRDGSNVAAYLEEIRRLDLRAYKGLLETLQHVLPYARDIQPAVFSEVDRSLYLKLKEADFEVPGWALSTGTLRIAAIMACLRHPEPPALLVIEEIENGLDPRTMHMLVEEFRAVIGERQTQIILTTHSPYLLDLLDVSHIVVVARENDETVFRRPDNKGLAEWTKSFAPGQLYTMGRLTRDEP